MKKKDFEMQREREREVGGTGRKKDNLFSNILVVVLILSHVRFTFT